VCAKKGKLVFKKKRPSRVQYAPGGAGSSYCLGTEAIPRLLGRSEKKKGPSNDRPMKKKKGKET